MCRSKLPGGGEAVTFVWPLPDAGQYALVTDVVRKDGVTEYSVERPLAKSYRASSYIDKAELQEFHDANVEDYRKEHA